jgi:hypothetical protein
MEYAITRAIGDDKVREPSKFSRNCSPLLVGVAAPRKSATHTMLERAARVEFSPRVRDCEWQSKSATADEERPCLANVLVFG